MVSSESCISPELSSSCEMLRQSCTVLHRCSFITSLLSLLIWSHGGRLLSWLLKYVVYLVSEGLANVVQDTGCCDDIWHVLNLRMIAF